jgi:hypothetical protein
MSNELPEEPRFIADAMLGRLARWLRLLGFDTLYYPAISDRDLLKLALQQERVLLTRDTHFLTMKRRDSIFFVRTDDPLGQVREVLTAFASGGTAPGRCARCNGILIAVGERDSLRDVVPEYVFLHYHDFLRCNECGNVYWEGTHLRRFRQMLRTPSEKEDRGGSS